MNRVTLLNEIIRTLKADTYLEIGVDQGWTFNKIICPHKIGVDPVSPIGNLVGEYEFYKMTSDDFFANFAPEYTVDVCFIDGLHTAEQALKDFNNAVKIMSPNGVIVFHDCLPKTEEMQLVPQSQSEWTGDVWKAFASIVVFTKKNLIGYRYRPFVFNADYGLGVVYALAPLMVLKDVPLLESLTWYDYCHSSKNLLDITSPDELPNFLKPLNE